MTPINAWSPRRLVQASDAPSGDRRSSPGLPRPFRSDCAAALASPAGRRRISPPFRWITHDPSRVRRGEWPGPSLRAPLPSAAAVQISRAAPAGSLSGLGISPARFGAPPRTKATVVPSAEIARPATSWPSSRVKEVRRRPDHSGPVASQTLRAPRSFLTQAKAAAELAAVSSVGKGHPTRESRSGCRA